MDVVQTFICQKPKMAICPEPRTYFKILGTLKFEVQPLFEESCFVAFNVCP